MPLPPSRCQITLSSLPSTAAALPSGVGIVDAAIHVAGVEIQRIRHAHGDELFCLGQKRDQRIRARSVHDRHVLAQAQGVVAVHPVVIEVVRRNVGSLELRARHGIERPALGALLSRRFRAVERPFALAPVEAGQIVAARQRHPHQAIGIDRDSQGADKPPRRDASDYRTAARRLPSCTWPADCRPITMRTILPGTGLLSPAYQTLPSAGLKANP